MFTKSTIEQYFISEKTGAFILCCIGIAALIFALISWFVLKTQVWKGFAIVFALLALIQVFVGASVYRRADKQRTDMVYNFDMNPQKIIDQEIPRMQEVNKRFTLYRYAEIACFIIGLGLFIYFRKNESYQVWAGIGIALALQALILFTFDKIAANRAHTYTESMAKFFKKPIN